MELKRGDMVRLIKARRKYSWLNAYKIFTATVIMAIGENFTAQYEDGEYICGYQGTFEKVS